VSSNPLCEINFANTKILKTDHKDNPDFKTPVFVPPNGYAYPSDAIVV